jgi:hypothetical protein
VGAGRRLRNRSGAQQPLRRTPHAPVLGSKRCCVSSSTISVFQVSRIRIRPVVPFGARTSSPTPIGACLSQFGESGAPMSDRSGRNPIFRYTIFIPAARAAWRTRAVGSIAPRIADMSMPARSNMPPTAAKSFCMSTTIRAVRAGATDTGVGLASMVISTDVDVMTSPLARWRPAARRDRTTSDAVALALVGRHTHDRASGATAEAGHP